VYIIYGSSLTTEIRKFASPFAFVG